MARETVAGVAGGVNAQMLPITTCTICGLSALSKEARCKTFDASADGYGRGEGFAGMIDPVPITPHLLPMPFSCFASSGGPAYGEVLSRS